VIYSTYVLTLGTAKMHSWGNSVVVFSLVTFLTRRYEQPSNKSELCLPL